MSEESKVSVMKEGRQVMRTSKCEEMRMTIEKGVSGDEWITESGNRCLGAQV